MWPIESVNGDLWCPFMSVHIDSLRSLLYLSYSLFPTSLTAYWLTVTVLPPIASFTITRALSGSTPSICSASIKIRVSQEEQSSSMTPDFCGCPDSLYLSVQVFMCSWLHQHTAAGAHHELLLLRSLLARLGGTLMFVGFQVFNRWTIGSETQTFRTELVLDRLYVSEEQQR